MVVIPEMLPSAVPANENWHIIVTPNSHNIATQLKSTGIRFQQGVSISDQPREDCTIYHASSHLASLTVSGARGWPLRLL
jgi:hypothetical protein